METDELQKPTTQLFNITLKKHLFLGSKQLRKSHNVSVMREYELS